MPVEVFELQAQLCRVMGHARRIEIIHLLRNRSRSVSELAEATRLSQASLSRHLSALRQMRLVTVERQGADHIYHLSDPKVGLIFDLIHRVLAEQLTRQVEAANQEVR